MKPAQWIKRRLVGRPLLAAVGGCALSLVLVRIVIDYQVRHFDDALQKQQQSTSAPEHLMPSEVERALSNPSQFVMRPSVAAAPAAVRQAFARLTGEDHFAMADPDGAWEPGCVIRDPKLPRRRLRALAIGRDLSLLFYEKGGIARNDHVAIFRTSPEGVKAVWHAFVDPNVRDPSALAKALQDRRYQESSSF